MAKILKTQEDYDRVFKRLERDFGKLNDQQEQFALKEFGRLISELSEFLAEFADDHGIIQRRRSGRVLRDLDTLEQNIRRDGEITLRNIIEETSSWTTSRLDREIGLGLSGRQFDRINKHVVTYIVKRFGEDGLVLSDRLWGLSGEIRDELASVIRSGIIKGDGINSMIPKIRRVYEAETWKIKRLARTESLTAHRGAIAYSAQESSVTSWVEFHAGVKRSDACVSLEEEDRHGQGAGIFKPTDTDIWTPHPNCTGYMSYVLDERWL